MKFAVVYPPPLGGLPWLSVMVLDGEMVDVVAFPDQGSAEAYAEVCNAGVASDLRRDKGHLDG